MSSSNPSDTMEIQQHNTGSVRGFRRADDSQGSGRPEIAWAPPPPFILETVRSAAIDHIAQYQKLERKKILSITDAPDLENASLVTKLPASNEQSSAEIRANIVCTKLTSDLFALCQCVEYLEDVLENRRPLVWLAESTLAIGVHMAASSASRFPLLMLGYYPIAAYKVVQHELGLGRVKSMRQAFERLLEDVQYRADLEDEDVEYVVGDKFDAVPWKLFPASVEACSQ